MRKFITSIVLFVLPVLYATQLFYQKSIQLNNPVGSEVYSAIERSLTPKMGAKVLLGGDSVGWQLFEPLNAYDDFVSMACNQAIDIIGHFLLIDDFFSKPNSVEKLYFLYNPFSLGNDLNAKMTRVKSPAGFKT